MKNILLISLLLFGCGRERIIDHELIIYTEVFKNDAKENNVDVSEIDSIDIIFDDLKDEKEEIIGVCDLGDKRIRIKREFWSNSNRFERELLMLHELGHCVLNEDHEDTISIMRPRLIMWWYYSQHRKELVKYLFSKRKK